MQSHLPTASLMWAVRCSWSGYSHSGGSTSHETLVAVNAPNCHSRDRWQEAVHVHRDSAANNLTLRHRTRDVGGHVLAGVPLDARDGQLEAEQTHAGIQAHEGAVLVGEQLEGNVDAGTG